MPLFFVFALAVLQPRPDIDQILEQQRQQLHIPGLAMAIVKNDQVVYVATIGQRDIEHDLPVTEETMFPIGSCTKAFTSMAIALAADRGLLSLDDHPRKFLPYVRMQDPEADAKVTLRDMLGHRTGLKSYADLAAEPGLLTREEYIRAATSAKPAVPFRSAFQYSNAMYATAGEIAGKVNGSTWEHTVETQIFAPLGMTQSVADVREMSAREHVTGYVYDHDRDRAVPPPQSLVALAPGGAVASSVRDMARWLRMLCAGGKGFVSPAMFHELTTPLIKIDDDKSYALGWATYEWNGMRVVEHNGGSQGISALISFIPEQHAGFVFLANASPSDMTKVAGIAGKMLYPLIVTAPDPLPRMIEAAGGEQALRRHTSLQMRARKSYENHGVVADLTIQEKAPAMHNEVEEWSAAGKHIAHFRLYFDGTSGGQETTFGQDSINDAGANARARSDYALHPLLEMKPQRRAGRERAHSRARSRAPLRRPEDVPDREARSRHRGDDLRRLSRCRRREDSVPHHDQRQPRRNDDRRVVRELQHRHPRCGVQGAIGSRLGLAGNCDRIIAARIVAPPAMKVSVSGSWSNTIDVTEAATGSKARITAASVAVTRA